jgi:hypothetical protein
VGRRGFLIDFDYAKSLADESDDDMGPESTSGTAENSGNLGGSSQARHSEASKHQQRTVCPPCSFRFKSLTCDLFVYCQGTMPFMAYTVLAGIDTTHTFKHDLESFFWVLLYLLMLPSEEKSAYAKKAALALEDLFQTDVESAPRKKASLLDESAKLVINPKYSVVVPYMEELKLLVKEEWEIARGRGIRPGLSYDGMLDILNRALGALEETNPRRVSPVSWQRILPKSTSKRSRTFASSPSSATLDPSDDEDPRPAKKKKVSRK